MKTNTIQLELTEDEHQILVSAALTANNQALWEKLVMANSDNPFRDSELVQLLDIKEKDGATAVVTHLLHGRDSMLVPVKELDSALLRLHRMAGLWQLKISEIAAVGEISGLIDGIIYARLSQAAAGLKAA